jgi:hypothetical protein
VIPPVAVLVAVTDAPGMAAPAESITFPEIVADVSCANRERGQISDKRRMKRMRMMPPGL